MGYRMKDQERHIISRIFPTMVAVWRGDVGLYRMLWLYLFVGFVGLAIPMNFVRGLGYQPSGKIWVIYSLGLVAYACFVCIGTWKAADKHAGSFVIKVMTKFTILLIYIIMSTGLLYGLTSSMR